MTQDRWKLVNQIFHAALDVAPGERETLVARHSNGDAEVQAEVERLLRADSEGGSFLETPLLHRDLVSLDAAVAPGDVLCGRFRIVREIGQGGMGFVFEAFDSELSLPIAVKLIRPELAPNREAISRFRQEVRLALAITHPNVCRTFDIQRETRVVVGKSIEVVFLTMELLRGETLASRIERLGRLPIPQALEVARQIAAALHSAHGMGIVHRDIKPANIMLVETPGNGQRAVVMDFGLARLDPLLREAGRSTFSVAGNPVGTLAYMAPEQLEARSVSPATDIYSFGLILYEMTTGKKAFPVDRLLSGIAQRLQGSIRLEQLHSNAVPNNWRRAIAWCIATDPVVRPQDTTAVIQLLESGRRWFLPRLGGPHSLLRHPANRRYARVSLILFAVALLTLGFRLFQSKASSKVAPGTLIYLTQVKNETGEKSLDGLTELIEAGLSQSTQVNLLDRARVEEILREMKRPSNAAIDPATAREIAMRSGLTRVVFATVTGSSGGYVLHLEIQQPDNTPSRYRERWTSSFSWKRSVVPGSGQIPSDLLEQVRSASEWIREESGESAKDIARLNTPPEDATTGNWEALGDYFHAEELLLNGRKDDGIAALERATESDPEFSLAFARLGDVLYSVNRWSEGLAAYRRAMSATSRQRLSRRELDRVRGIYASDTRDDATAEAQFRDVTSYYSSDWKAWFYRATPLMRLGHLEEAIESLKRAHALAPERLSPIATLAQFTLHGDDPADDEWIAELHRRGFNLEAAWLEGERAIVNGDPKTAEQRFAVVRDSSSPVRAMNGYQLLARVAAEEGDFSKAQEMLNRALKLADAQGDRGAQATILMDRAWIDCRLDRGGDCERDAERSYSIDRSPQSVRAASLLVIESMSLPLHGGQQPLAAFLEHVKGDFASDEIGPVFEMARLEREGALQLAHRNCEAALKSLRAEAAIDAPVESREYLAVALERCSQWDRSQSHARALRTEAADAYAAAAFTPALVWDTIQFSPPGAYADQLSGWLRTTSERGRRYSDASERMRLLRPSEFPRGTVPEGGSGVAP